MQLRPLRVPTTFALLSLLSLLSLAPSCGSSGGGDQTTKFVGPWTFSSGELTPTCSFISTSFVLKGLSATFVKVDNSTISVAIGTACTVKFAVSGATATVEPKQTCTLDLGGALGATTVAIKTWTLMLSGDQIDNTIDVSSICDASGMAVLVRGAPDGGAPDGSTKDGSTKDASTTDASTTDVAGSEVGQADGSVNDAATDVSDGGASDAPVDTTTTSDAGGETAVSDAGGDAG
ncbi:MAG TPA: hypothetical protein VH560_05155 [Polyangia bacterium]|nr:hypothetical protein [Polyangia bacterium]